MLKFGQKGVRYTWVTTFPYMVTVTQWESTRKMGGLCFSLKPEHVLLQDISCTGTAHQSRRAREKGMGWGKPQKVTFWQTANHAPSWVQQTDFCSVFRLLGLVQEPHLCTESEISLLHKTRCLIWFILWWRMKILDCFFLTKNGPTKDHRNALLWQQTERSQQCFFCNTKMFLQGKSQQCFCLMKSGDSLCLLYSF